MHKSLLAAGMLMLAACSPGHETVSSVSDLPRDRLELVDLAHEFDAVVMARPDASAEEAFAELEARFSDRLPGFYGHERFGDQADFVRGVRTSALGRWGEQRGEALRVADEFAGRFDDAIERFEAAVGPLPTERPVYLVMSLGEFDGATRNFGQGENLYFGADAIAQYYPGASTMPFLHHELFHVYHSPRMGDCAPIWCSLWNEGLATYAASRLNPGSSDIELGLHLPQPIRPVLDARREEAICAVRASLDREGSEFYNPLFTGMGHVEGALPARFGYLVGLWVAQDLGEGYTLAEMAEWNGTELRSRIGASLAGMADCD